MGYLESNKEIAKILPDESLDVCDDNLYLFFQTMYERQKIWYKRNILKREAPWTDDKFLRDYKFTNVYRELDRNSQFQINHIIKVEKNRTELIWKMMFFRFFNQPEFFTFIEEFTKEADEDGAEDFSFVGMIPRYNKFRPLELKALMEAYRAIGGNPFTNAYLTNSQACPEKTRDECFAFKVIPMLHKLVPKISRTLEEAGDPDEIIKLLLTLPSVSNFMAHEFYQDFTYVPRYTGVELMDFDQDDYTNVGPGCEAGIRLIFPNRKTNKEKLAAIYYLRDIAPTYLAKFGDFKYLGYNQKAQVYICPDILNEKVTLHQIEMWLCEFQKYWKMQVGIGKQRSKFTPKKAEKHK